MKKHPLDTVALLFGIAFGIVAAAFIVNETSSADIDPSWITAGGLILLGAIALAITVVRGAREPSGDDAGIAERGEG